MNFDKRYMVGLLALVGCAAGISAYVIRQRNRLEKAREHQNALEVWENEGGIVAAPVARAASAY